MPANTTGTVTDAVLRMRRELPDYELHLRITPYNYTMYLSMPESESDSVLSYSSTDNEWARAINTLIDKALKEGKLA